MIYSIPQIYQFPECDPDEDEAFKKQDKELKASVPFAVSGSCQILEVNGRRFRGRIYPWGVVEGMCVSCLSIHVYIKHDCNEYQPRAWSFRNGNQI